MYTLAEWNEYTGSLFELAVDLVEATKTPIKIEELAKEKSIILEFNRYFDKFENKVDMESVDTKESYI